MTLIDNLIPDDAEFNYSAIGTSPLTGNKYRYEEVLTGKDLKAAIDQRIDEKIKAAFIEFNKAYFGAPTVEQEER